MPTTEKNRHASTGTNATTTSWLSSKEGDRRQSSVNETASSDRNAPSKILPPPVAKCGSLESPYDAAVVRNWDAKLFSNKVSSNWYKRYAGVTPEMMQFQPFDEVRKREEVIALQYYMGPSYRLMETPEDPLSIKQKDAYIRRYSKVKHVEEDKRFRKDSVEPEEMMRVFSLRSIIATKRARDLAMKDMFGPSGQEKQKTETVCKVFMHMRNKRKRKSIAEKRVKPHSKWNFLKSPAVRKRLRSINKIRLASEARQKFVRIIHTVFHIRNFICVVSRLAGDTHSIFSGLKHLKAERERLLNKSNQTDSSRMKQFDPARYTFNKEVRLTPEIKLTLTVPCFQRSYEEVEKVRDEDSHLIVETLQQIRAFVAYPIAYQRVIAKAAWYIVVPAFRVVIRERHDAVSYYFMINGRANMQKLLGNPDHMKASQFKQIRVLRAQDMFGEEAITNPGCKRSYTVTTDTVCEMLSINCSELQDAMLTTSSVYETAPEHIRFLGALNAMRKFPKLKLLEEAQDNINIAHFLGGAVVTTNVETSDYVYFVYYGTCDVLKEIPPPQSVVDNYAKTKLLREADITAEGTISPLSRKSVLIRDAMKPETEEGSPFFTDNSTHRKTYFASRLEYIESRENLRNVFMKEIERRQNEYISYKNVFMAEARELEDKCRQIATTIPTAARKRLLGGHIACPRPPPIEFHSSLRLCKLKDSSANSNLDLGKDKLVDDVDTPKKVAKTGSISINQDVLDDTRKQRQFLSVPPQNSSRFSSKVSSREASMEFLGGRDDKDERVRTSRRLTKLVGSNMNLLDAVFSPAILHEPVQTPPSRDASRIVRPTEKKDGQGRRLARLSGRPQMSNFSKWAMVRTAIRGDVVGTEFLDFRSGPFEPPKEIWSIVTPGGATLIMVKKSFLLKYLRKQW